MLNRAQNYDRVSAEELERRLTALKVLLKLFEIWCLSYLIVMGSLVAYMAYIWLLGIRPASLVGTYAYVNPVVAVFLGWLIANEHVSMMKIIGLTVIIAGLVIVNISKEKKLSTVDNSLAHLKKVYDDQEPALRENKAS